MTRPSPPFRVVPPAAPLRGYISHYWLSRDNTDRTFPVIPDGAVDVVVAVGATRCEVQAYGSTTTRTELPLALGAHYLGVRFKPGQSRHFLDVPAAALTDSALPAEGLVADGMLRAAESIASDGLFAGLDATFLRHLERRPAARSTMDDAIRHIESRHGALRIGALAEMSGRSRRQFERQFVDAVGLPAKLFAEIVRFRRALSLLARSRLPLAQIAADSGYSDQSHLSRECARFYGKSPSRVRGDVAFLQDGSFHNGQDEGSLHP